MTILLNVTVAAVMLSAAMPAPEFEAKTHDGSEIRLSEMYRRGPVMLVFIRGFG